jgi:single-stranded-DNA-specific exonuclease
MGNQTPVFCARGVNVVAEPRVMKEKHLSLEFRQRGAGTRAVWFGAASHTLPKPPWDVAFTVERNEYQGTVRAQMQVKAVRSTA